jgi:hypothetical protein
VLIHQTKTLQLRRRDVVCPTCEVGFFPPDDELVLPLGQLTPCLHESVILQGENLRERSSVN